MATYRENSSAYDMFSWYKYLIVSLVFSRLVFWSGNLFLIAPFPDRCLPVPFCLPNRNKTPWVHPRSEHWHLIDYVIVRRTDRQDVRVTKTMCVSQTAGQRS